ncbi:MAG: helix-turn-helix domain-containing protein [Clostridiales bacterium]|nr:helix-turn-helix domain-containing protein [Clostridiales bacterium]
MKFAKRLKELREEKNFSQKKLAEEINYTQSIVSLWELDKRDPTATAIAAVACYLNVTADYLLGLTDEAGNFRNFSDFDLRNDERQLLKLYNSLEPRQKDNILTTMRLFNKL